MKTGFSLTGRVDRQEIAAIDLGSNSFHMVVARFDQGEMRIQDRMKESVRLGFGIDEFGRLSREAQVRALACLARFASRITHLPGGSVRCVGTKTLRQAQSAQAFIKEAQQVLGHRIAVISGAEEARLIYAGVVHSIARPEQTQLVIDIGGGSTEFILGQAFKIHVKDSVDMGCVALMRDFFQDDQVTATRLQQALLACQQELEPVQRVLGQLSWDVVLGASGTMQAVYEVCLSNQLSTVGIELPALKQLCKRYVEHGQVQGLKLKGLSRDREPVFLGGVIALRALMEALSIEHIEPALGALREGLLYDLVGRSSAGDLRQRSVQLLAQRFHVNSGQAQGIAQTVIELWSQTPRQWSLPLSDAALLLQSAAHLLEVGLDIAHDQYHKHSAYIVEYSDLPGFAMDEQQLLAYLVRAQRKRYPRANPALQQIASTKRLQRLACLLRLAVLLHRVRAPRPANAVQLQAKGKRIIVRIAPQWLAEHSLLVADLQTEQRYAAEVGLQIELA